MIETPNYSIIRKIDDIELRKYPPMLIIKVEKTDDDNAFGYLFKYITGSNKSRTKIPMTAPVITSETIPMTAPVLSNQKEMAFVVPRKYSSATVPIPTDPKVKLDEIPERMVAVLRFSGYTSPKRVKQFEQILINKLNTNEIRVIGPPFLMRYNSPFAVGFMRRNEVAVEIALN